LANQLYCHLSRVGSIDHILSSCVRYLCLQGRYGRYVRFIKERADVRNFIENVLKLKENANAMLPTKPLSNCSSVLSQ
jgi:hypothetical protein